MPLFFGGGAISASRAPPFNVAVDFYNFPDLNANSLESTIFFFNIISFENNSKLTAAAVGYTTQSTYQMMIH